MSSERRHGSSLFPYLIFIRHLLLCNVDIDVNVEFCFWSLFNISKRHWLVGSSVSVSTSAVPTIVASAILVVSPKPMLSIISGLARVIFTPYREWRMLLFRMFFFTLNWASYCLIFKSSALFWDGYSTN